MRAISLSTLGNDRTQRLKWLVTLVPACAVLVVEVLHHWVFGEGIVGVAGTAIACAAALAVSYPIARFAFDALDRARGAATAKTLELEALDALVHERERLGRELHDGTAQTAHVPTSAH
jgi:signal transduction histidine kinase